MLVSAGADDMRALHDIGNAFTLVKSLTDKVYPAWRCCLVDMAQDIKDLDPLYGRNDSWHLYTRLTKVQKYMPLSNLPWAHHILVSSRLQCCSPLWTSHCRGCLTEYSDPGQPERESQTYNSTPCLGRRLVPEMWLYWAYCCKLFRLPRYIHGHTYTDPQAALIGVRMLVSRLDSDP
jgi:hypothetical protein